MDGRGLEGVKVLVVEDDPASAKLVVVVLEDEAGVVRTASSAEDAFAQLARDPPDLIILDLILPLMSGLLFAQQLKSQPATAAIPIIAVSAFNGSTVQRAALAVGCCAYIRKPIDVVSFPQLVRSHLGGR
jgi:CheY-like chemotaxis protein